MFFHQNIKTIRKAWGLSQKDIADKYGVSQGTASAWENGTEPSFDILISLSDFFKVSIDDLIRKEIRQQDVPERWSGRDNPSPANADTSKKEIEELKRLVLHIEAELQKERIKREASENRMETKLSAIQQKIGTESKDSEPS
jgi:transcriptional regulator with XRE-family HTH domain